MATKVEHQVSLRWYDEADLDGLVRVHALCYPDEKWTASDFRRFAGRPAQIVRAIVSDVGEVVGSLLYRMEEGVANIARVAVVPHMRGKGVGSAALATLTGPRSPSRKEVCVAKVREHNVAAQFLMKKNKFKHVETLPAFYKDAKVVLDDGQVLVTDEDAYVFVHRRESAVRKRRKAEAAEVMAAWP